MTTLDTVGCQNLMVHHQGVHQHNHPPPQKASPSSSRVLEEIVSVCPDMGPAKLSSGNKAKGVKGLLQVDDAYLDQDRVARQRRKLLEKRSSRPSSIRGSIGAMIDFLSEIEDEKFIVKNTIHVRGARVLVIMSESMRELIQAGEPFQADTVEGLINEIEMTSCKADVHFISTFCQTLLRWCPAMISIVFGRTAITYQEIWECLLDNFSDGMKTWKDFSVFPGCTMDWSLAEGNGFKLALAKHAKEKFNHELSASALASYLRKCEVHFLRSYQRVRDNARVVPPEKIGHFVKLVNTMRDKSTSFSVFSNAVKNLVTEFPEAKNWVAWYLTTTNAPHFFPACQKDFSPEEQVRFSKLCSTTNAEENVGRQFKHKFGNCMTINEFIQNAYLWVTQQEHQRTAVVSGKVPLKQARAVATIASNARRKVIAQNDGRAPDTTKKLVGKKKQANNKVSSVKVNRICFGCCLLVYFFE
jgi:hypothetical protein